MKTVAEKKLGRMPAKSDVRALLFKRFAEAPKKLPAQTSFWPHRSPFELRTFGNNDWGDCTLAKQAQAALRMERLETRATPKITDGEIIKRYQWMLKEVYGTTDDVGAYETDALDRWRDPNATFKDTHGRSITIDAYTRINHLDQAEIRQALWTAGAHGIAICLNLPMAFSGVEPPADWDIPDGQQPLGDWTPGSWGGHSMWARDYDETGIWLVHTWGLPDQRLTWRAVAVYLDEAHLVIDSLDAWRKRTALKKLVNFDAIKKAVNEVSRIKIH